MAAPKPARMRGIGDLVTPVPTLPEFWLVLVNPGHHVPTPRVFELFARLYGEGHPEMEALPSIWDFEAFHVWLLDQSNDLTKCASEDATEVQDVLDALRSTEGCVDCDMSGSGSTCWGMFQTSSGATDAARRLAGDKPKWWVHATGVLR